MNEVDFEKIVTEVIRRVAQRIGADGRNGDLTVVFTGATVGLTEAIQQVRGLILEGFKVELAFSAAAERLYANIVTDGLNGFPHVTLLDEKKWLLNLKQTKGVVVPMLSVNTASKISNLIADNCASNLILHALFVGVPVVAAKNGVDPTGEGRKELGFHRGQPALIRALGQTMETLQSFGIRLVEINHLRDVVNSICGCPSPSFYNRPPIQRQTPYHSSSPPNRVLTAKDVREASLLNSTLVVSRESKITPLARELAEKYGVILIENDDF